MTSLRAHRALNAWSAVFVPAFLFASVGYVSYVVTRIVAVDYLLDSHPHYRARNLPQRSGSAIAILTIHYFLLIIWLSVYLRLLCSMVNNAGYVPLRHPPEESAAASEKETRLATRCCAVSEVEEDWDTENDIRPAFDVSALLSGSQKLPPGSSELYTKEVFACDPQGLPSYCHKCRCYKVDRMHHSSDVGRCVRRMDHFCPWVGGMVCEVNHKWFIQFLLYSFCLSVFVLVVVAYYLGTIKDKPANTNVHLIVAVSLAGMLALFSTGMVLNSSWMIFQNVTTIESLDKSIRIYYLAVRVNPEQLSRIDASPYAIITYPLRSASHASTMAPPPPTRQHSASPAGPQDFRTSRHSRHKPRTFVVLQTRAGENPWSVSAVENWKQIMGEDLLDWFLPIKPSPILFRDRKDAEYAYGPALDRLKRDAGLV